MKVFSEMIAGALWQSALQILERLQDSHHKSSLPNSLDIASFGAAVTSCVREGEWQRVLELLRDMRRLSMHNVWTLNEAIACFAKVWSFFGHRDL